MAQSAQAETRTVTLRGAEKSIRRAMKRKRPIFVWGPPGIGKSDLMEQITGSFKKGWLIDLRMALMEPTDLRGIPYYNQAENTMSWAHPVDLPTAEQAEEYDIVILFLDELNSAPMATQAAAYQLVLNGRIGTYKLPDNCVIVAAGNRETDRGVTYRMPSPLANRFVHVEVAADFDVWQEWAVENQIHPDVLGYLTFSKNDLYNFDAGSNERSFATPRSWVFVSELLQEEDGDPDMAESEITDLVAGTVGEGLAVKFNAHRKHSGKLPNPSDILDGTVTKLEVKEVSAMYSLTISMCYELRDAYKKAKKQNPGKEWHAMCDNFFRFMMDNFLTEVTVMGAKMALTNYNLPLVPGKLKSFDEFHKRFGKYVISAMEG